MIITLAIIRFSHDRVICFGNYQLRVWNVKFYHVTIKHINLFLHLGTIYIYTICRKLMIRGHSSKV